MINKVSLKNFKLLSNYLLIKPDPNHDILVLEGPEGRKIELQIAAFGEDEANHFSISGIVIKKPATTFFFDKTTECTMLEFASGMKASLQVDCDYDFNEGDRIIYNYNVQLGAEPENRLIDTEEHGLCMLITIDSVYGYKSGEDIIPVNGYVFYIRDQEEAEVKLESGLILVKEVNKYAMLPSTITAVSKPVRAYLDGGVEGRDVFKPGDRVFIDKRFGYRMAYDMHGAELTNVEVCRRKHLLAVLEEA